MTEQTREPALKLQKLRKVYGNKVVVNSIDLSVPAGSFFGIVGPNGAGKTTSLSMATGLLRPDGGTARIFGVDIWKEPEHAKALIGILPDGLAMPERLTGREALTYLGLLRGLDADQVAKRTDELLDLLGFADDNDTLIMDYSTGMRKKIGLATALLHAPKLLVLDEPFEAVDPVSASTIKMILQRFIANGGSVIFSSHVMALVEQLCDSVAIIHKGEVMAAGTLEEVRQGQDLEQRFVELVDGEVGGKKGLEWFAS
ncbi:ABC transporter ATP-binding protein [Streptomyces caniscabiei]|uniref:ABC transporter ATP-binding protein n=1 Tax=Streptomyces caniscabiei TaxID=2746961 RepID=UPI0029B8C36A|nr:ABC transporter ATP-binding protein [Streptomyces caniscabiei]MDX2776143.1 ABC transporter ATP-binding protein [Streptomyces caniscabiei]